MCQQVAGVDRGTRPSRYGERTRRWQTGSAGCRYLRELEQMRGPRLQTLDERHRLKEHHRAEAVEQDLEYSGERGQVVLGEKLSNASGEWFGSAGLRLP